MRLGIIGPKLRIQKRVSFLYYLPVNLVVESLFAYSCNIETKLRWSAGGARPAANWANARSPTWLGVSFCDTDSATPMLCKITSRVDACYKLFERKSFNISSTKHRLIIKLIAELVCKLRDESNGSN